MSSARSLRARVQDLRAQNSLALLTALKSSTAHSEESLQKAWVRELSALQSLAMVGWYVPPPDGCTVLIGNEPAYERVAYQSIRVEEKWPRADVLLEDNSLIFAFSSPVTSDGLIGDFGLPLCRTSSAPLRSTIREIFSLAVSSALRAEEGMTFRELYHQVIDLCAASGFENEAYSITDSRGTNVGHTLPWTYEALSPDERGIFESGALTERQRLISEKRIFVNDSSVFRIASPVAFTMEPKLGRGDLPPLSFHLTVVFENGQRHLLAGFKPLLEYFGMSTWLDGAALRELDKIAAA